MALVSAGVQLAVNPVVPIFVAEPTTGAGSAVDVTGTLVATASPQVVETLTPPMLWF